MPNLIKKDSKEATKDPSNKNHTLNDRTVLGNGYLSQINISNGVALTNEKG